MVKMLRYTSVLKSRPYLYLEIKKASDLILQGFTNDDIKIKSIEDNLFLVNTEGRKREMP